MSKKQLEKEIEIKVVLLGESGVGKSSIIIRYANDMFAQINLTTILCSNTTKTISLNNNKDTIKYNIWDTAGQEKYKSITKFHYQDADVIILVFDITSLESFEQIRNYWYPQIQENAPQNSITALVASKCDLKDEYNVDIDEVASYAKQIDAIFQETSAKDSFGINELFEEIGNKILSIDNFKDMIYKRNKTLLTDFSTDEDENSVKSTKTGQLRTGNDKKHKSKKKCC